MTENYSRSEYYRKLGNEVISEHKDLEWLIVRNVRIDYIVSGKEKKRHGADVFGECKKIEEIYQLYTPFDFLVIIYAPNIIELSDEQKKILLYHELLHIGIEEKDGKLIFRINPHDVEDFRKVIDQYGIDWAR